MASLSELRERRRQIDEEAKQLDQEIAKAKEQALIVERERVANKLEAMTDEEKELILKHMRHSRTSCSDDNACNGLYSTRDGQADWRCDKCMLIEMFNGEHWGNYDFKLTVDITRVDV